MDSKSFVEGDNELFWIEQPSGLDLRADMRITGRCWKGAEGLSLRAAIFKIASIIVCSGLNAPAYSFDDSDLLDLPVSINQPLSEVQKKLGTILAPKKQNQVLVGRIVEDNNKELKLKTKGIKVYFSDSNLVKKIVFLEPFESHVFGVKIGDDRLSVIEKHGVPEKSFETRGRVGSIIYGYKSDRVVGFVFSDDDKVFSIFIGER